MSDDEIEPFKTPPDIDQWAVNLIHHVTARLDKLSKNIANITPAFNTEIQLLKREILTDVRNAKSKAQESLDLSLANNAAITQLKSEMHDMRILCTGLYEDNKTLIMKCEQTENYSRRDNLVVRGLPEQRDENEEQCVIAIKSFFLNVLKIDAETVQNMPYVRCHRLGARSVSDKYPRPMIFRFHRYRDRKFVWDQRHKLAGTKYSLNENFASTTEYKRRKLYPILAAAKKSGNYEKKAYLNLDKLRIKDKDYGVEDLHRLPAELQPQKLAVKSSGDCVVFGGIHSDSYFMSNYYQMPNKLKYEGFTYPTSEHAYQHAKSRHFRDIDSSYLIMSAKDPATAKRYGQKVANFDKNAWDLQKEHTMVSILRTKFDPESDLANQLLATKGKTLAEAGTSPTFSIGLTLSNKKIFDKRSWTGANLLGKCLEQIRDELDEKEE